MDFKVRISRKALIISLVVLLLAAILCFVVIPWIIAWNDFCHIENNKYNAFNERIKFAEFEIHNWGMNPSWNVMVYELYTDGTVKYYLKYDDLDNIEEKRANLSKIELVRFNKFLKENIETGKYRTEGGTTIIEENIFSTRYITGADGSGWKIIYYGTDGSKYFSFGPGYVGEEVRDLISLLDEKLEYSL